MLIFIAIIWFAGLACIVIAGMMCYDSYSRFGVDRITIFWAVTMLLMMVLFAMLNVIH